MSSNRNPVHRPNDTQENVIKVRVVTLGDIGVGKSNLVLRITGRNFVENIESTIGGTNKQTFFM